MSIGSEEAGRGKLTPLERYHLLSLMDGGPLLLLEPASGLNAQAVERGWAQIGASFLGETLSITPAGRAALSATEGSDA